ncbi:helix-turn-helix domain-containing protein [Actinomadura graeca]|uniref:Helix-turn-helix domain-containing protein n=1 Tax=Actinomadura graeca TaxID=2750812 RepID=A0ABX8QP41_9ACTN|nr:helix-turn-helix domain-containing protein [Actinomadura graeca]QXJ20171.1 helix-turn-helix domain-containing protein [Actinomadura graeca]
MGDLFGSLTRRVDTNARRAVDAYTRELPEYRTMAAGDREFADLLEFAVLLRRRTVELARDVQPFTDADLALIASVGHERGRAGVSLGSHRRVLGLHSTLTVREIHEAAGATELDALMQILGWIGPQGVATQDAYTRGFLEGQRHTLPFAERVEQLAGALLAGEPAGPELARRLGMPVPAAYLLTVVRIADEDAVPAPSVRSEILGILLDLDRVPMGWQGPLEFVVLPPAGGCDPAEATAEDRRRALTLAAAFAESVGRRCAVGATVSDARGLPEALPLARRICRAAPLEPVPRRVSTIADVFVELGAAGLPEIDRWLRRIADLLFQGPDLVVTLDAYYRHDMNRLLTAAHLYVHPRTLDYRLRRARELTGIDPTTTRGVRTLSAAVARILAAA